MILVTPQARRFEIVQRPTLSPDFASAMVTVVAPTIFAIVSSSPSTAFAISTAYSPAAVVGEVANALARAFDVIIVQQPLVTGPLLSSASQWFVC